MISTLTRKHSFDLVFDSQKMFRLILEALANPTRVVSIYDCARTLFGDHPAFLAIALTLLDNEVSFNTCEHQALSAEITSLTLTNRARLESADFVFVSNPNRIKEVIKNVKHGTLSDPHKSATVIIRNDDEPNHLLTLKGPGIDGSVEVLVSRIVADTIQYRNEQYYEYPQGIDLFFVSSAGELLAIPRLVSLAVR